MSSRRRHFNGLEYALLLVSCWDRLCRIVPDDRTNILHPTNETQRLRCKAKSRYIFGAHRLLRYAVTRLFSDGCFQAHNPGIIDNALPFSLRLVFGTLYVCLGCFPLDSRHLSAAVEL